MHGHQQLSLFNGHHGERCFLPIHVHDVETSRPVLVLLRPGRTPSGREVRGHLRRLVRRIRCQWPTTRLTIRGDGHYGRPEVTAWCEAHGIDFVFGLPGNGSCPTTWCRSASTGVWVGWAVCQFAMGRLTGAVSPKGASVSRLM